MPRIVDNYSLNSLIGEGVYGRVYLAHNIKTGAQFAVKVVPMQRFQENPKLQQCTFNEVQTLSQVAPGCPYIVRFVEMLRTANNFYFVYEYCNGGTLYAMLKKEGKLPEAKALCYFKQLVDAFRVLSKNNIMHRDLKPDNILFHNGTLKLGDFGFCKNLKEDNDMTATMLGSPIYMAPEVLKGDSYTTKADIWSLGVVLFQMLYGFCPFETGSIAQLIAKVTTTTVQFPVGVTVSEATQILIRRMLEKDPVRRIDWNSLFALVPPTDKPVEDSPSKSASMTQLNNSRLQQSIENIPPWQLKSELKKNMPGTGSSSAIKLYYPSSDSQSLSHEILPRRLHLTPDSKLTSTNPVSSISAIKPLPLSDRRKLFLAEHRFCTNGIRTAAEFSKNDDNDSLVYSYLLLKKSQQRLRKLCQDIPSAESQLQDIVGACSNELRQLERQLQFLSDQMTKCQIQLRQLSEAKKFLSCRFRQTEPQLRLWQDMVTFLLCDKTTHLLNRNMSPTQMLPNIRLRLGWP